MCEEQDYKIIKLSPTQFAIKYKNHYQDQSIARAHGMNLREYEQLIKELNAFQPSSSSGYFFRSEEATQFAIDILISLAVAKKLAGTTEILEFGPRGINQNAFTSTFTNFHHHSGITMNHNMYMHDFPEPVLLLDNEMVGVKHERPKWNLPLEKYVPLPEIKELHYRHTNIPVFKNDRD